MATINSRAEVNIIIKGNGIYPGDRLRVIKIVEYTNNWGRQAFGLIYKGEDPDRYRPSEFIKNPKTIWEYHAKP